MRTLFILLTLLFTGSIQAQASCMTPAEVRKSYNGCMQFLKLSPAKQLKVAANVPYTLKQVKSACDLQKRKGLKHMLANAREVCRVENSDGTENNGHSTPYEPHTPICSGSADCRGGYCGAANVCSNAGWGAACDNSSQCASGYCGAGGTCH